MTPLESGRIENVFDYLLWYAKDKSQAKYRNLFIPKRLEGSTEFKFIRDGDRGYRELTIQEAASIDRPDITEHVFKRSVLESSGFTLSCTFPYVFEGKEFRPPGGGKSWRTNAEGMGRLDVADRLFVLGKKLYFKLLYADFPYTSLINTWPDTVAGYGEQKQYVVETHPKIVRRCMLMTTDPGDLVLDPTCGSGTTAYVAEQWGRRWITIDTSRVALTLARTRVMSARYPYYLLADSPEGVRRDAEITGRVPPPHKTENDIRKGFVYKRVPHITLKSIANNPDIQEGMSRERIDAAIARHAGQETLFDQPYEDKSRIRVSGPFTVESLSPHRVLSTDEDRPESENQGDEDSSDDFVEKILDNLRTAGVQNQVKNERLKFDSLDAFAGSWIQGSGEYTDAEDKRRCVAVSIGPEHGTVGPEHVKEAAKEAVQGVGFDVLVVCGFAFDPHVSEEAKRYGKLTVLPTRMNNDLAMGGDLLKKTGSGNLFMVFGEPDLDIQPQDDGKLVVEIRGVDVYDPTTGEIRSNSTDDIACWFIDTDYNAESFFVRHAYFTGADQPYEKLKKALRAEIDESAWSELYSTVSRPFDPPSTGKIAVKVINHYGDEVLKVYEP